MHFSFALSMLCLLVATAFTIRAAQRLRRPEVLLFLLLPAALAIAPLTRIVVALAAASPARPAWWTGPEDLAILLPSILVIPAAMLLERVGAASGRDRRGDRPGSACGVPSASDSLLLESGAALWVTTPAHERILVASPGCEALTGCSRAALLAHPAAWLDSLHPDDRDRAAADIEACRDRSADQVCAADYRFGSAEGWRWMRLVTRPIRGPDGAVTARAGVAHDVTELHDVQGRHGVVRQRLDVALDGTRSTIWEHDLEEGVVERDGLALLLGYDPRTMRTAAAWRDVIHSDDVALFDAAIASVRARGAGRIDVICRTRGAGGEVCAIRHVGRVIERDEDGRGLRLLGVDVRLESARDEVLRDVAGSVPVLLAYVDREGRYRYHNEAYARLHGRRTLVGCTMRDVLGEERYERIRPVIERALAGEAVEDAVEVERRDRPNRVYQRICVPHFGPDGEVLGLSLAGLDVTAHHRSAAELRERVEMERMLRQELDHRVRGNLAALSSLVELTRRTVTDVGGFAAVVDGRIRAMAALHALVTAEGGTAMRFSSLFKALLPEDLAHRVTLEGDDVAVPPRSASSLALILHELIANGVKHGSLGSRGGRLRLSWEVEGDRGAHDRMRLHWREEGGPMIETRPVRGFGTSLIEGLVRSDLHGDVALDFPPAGADHDLEITIDRAIATSA